MAEAIAGNCGSCELSGGNRSCAVINALAEAGMPDVDLDIASTVLSLGDTPTARVNMDIVFPEPANAAARGQKFSRVIKFLDRVPILSQAVIKHDVAARRKYTSDTSVIQDFCATVSADSTKLDIPTYPRSAQKDNASDISEESVNRSKEVLSQVLTEWMLGEIKQVPRAEDITNCSDGDLLKIIMSARKCVINAPQYIGSDVAEERLKKISYFTIDSDRGSVQKRMLDYFYPEEPSHSPQGQGTDSEKGWQDYANCMGVDPDLFFPERGASTREAKEVCKGCVVREDCLEYALAGGEKFGIWGGLSERERRRIRRQRSIARRARLL